MANLGPTELIIILVIVVLIFGAGKLPEIGGALGKGIREFKEANKEIHETTEELNAELKDVKTEGEDKPA
jgi:sec-independent protein translocase protein TatA